MGRIDTVGYKIRLIHNRIHKTMEAKREANQDDLTGMQRWTIGFLKEHETEEIYQRDIEAAFSVSRATASNMLSVMERKGLIERLSVAHDARLKKLVLTPKATNLLERAQADVREMEETILRGMSQEEILAFKTALDRIMVNLGEETMH